MQSNQNDWRSSPNLNVISVIISIIGLIISSFSDISTPVKIAVIVVGLAACLYVIISGKPLLTLSTSIVQNPADVTYAAPPAPSLNWEDDQLSPAINYPQSPPTQSVRANPAQPPPVTGIGTSGWFSSLKDVSPTLLVCAIMFGLPGFFLFRSSVAWQHIVGTILLIILGVVVMGVVMPNPGDDAHKISYKLRDVLAMVIGSSFIFGLPGLLLVQSSVAWQHIVGIILLILFLGVPVSEVRDQFFENPGSDKTSN